MLKPKKLLLSTLFSLIGLCFPATLHAQFIGDVGLQTINQQLATGTTCTGAAQPFTTTNIGAISHQASAFFSTATSAASVVLEIDGQDGISTYKISSPQISFATTLVSGTDYIAQGAGYYPKIIVSITCTIGAVFNLYYSGAQSAFSPLIGPPGGTVQSLNNGITNQVQGIVTQQQSGGTVNPIIDGALQLPVNGNFLTAGIDNFNTSNAPVSAGSSGPFPIVFPPTPTKSGEFGIAFEANISDGTATSILAPWTCAPSFPGVCGGGSPQMSMAYLANVSAGNALVRTFTNSTPAGQDIGSIVLFSSSTAAIRQDNLASGAGGTVAYLSNTLAGSAKIAAVRCAGTVPCTVSGVTDTQGGTWFQVTGTTFNNGNQAAGLWVWASSTLSTAAADTITFTISAGSVAGTMAAEVSGITTSSLTQPAISLAANTIGTQIVTEDAQFPNQFVCSVAISTNTTTQCQPAPTTINSIAVRAYVTDVQINTTTQGTTSTLQLKTGTGTNCGTGTANLSAITYSSAVASLISMLDFRTPLFAPLQSAVCVTQAGAVAGTAVVEVHGYFAP
jgi:hypothetical protein